MGIEPPSRTRVPPCLHHELGFYYKGMIRDSRFQRTRPGRNHQRISAVFAPAMRRWTSSFVEWCGYDKQADEKTHAGPGWNLFRSERTHGGLRQ